MAVPARATVNTTRTDITLRPAGEAMVFFGPGKPHETIAVPGVSLADDDVLVAVELSTICASDLHTVRGARSAPVPLVLGHESVGRVIALGRAGADAVDGTPLRIGDRVVWSVAISCGACDRCRRGLTQKCRELSKYGHETISSCGDLAGGFASHVQLRAGSAIVRAPESLPAAALAPVSCATATAWAAVRHAGRQREVAGARVRVYGAGLLGLSAVAVAAEQGAIVEIVDPDPVRRERAQDFGALAVADAGEVADVDVDGEIDVVIEASGRAVAQAIDDVAVGGTVVLVGSVFPAEPVPLNAEAIVRRMITVTGVHNYTAADLANAVDFLTGPGRDRPFAEAVGTVHPLTEIDAAIDAASAAGAPLRVGVVPR